MGPGVCTHVERFPGWPHGNRTQWSCFRRAQGQKSDVGIPPRLCTTGARYLSTVFCPLRLVYTNHSSKRFFHRRCPLPPLLLLAYAATTVRRSGVIHYFHWFAPILTVSLITGAIRVGRTVPRFMVGQVFRTADSGTKGVRNASLRSAIEDLAGSGSAATCA